MDKEQAEKIINGEEDIYKGYYKGFKYSVLRSTSSASPNALIQSDLIVFQGDIEKDSTVKPKNSFYKKDCKKVIPLSLILDVDKQCKSRIDQLIKKQK